MQYYQYQEIMENSVLEDNQKKHVSTYLSIFHTVSVTKNGYLIINYDNNILQQTVMTAKEVPQLK